MHKIIPLIIASLALYGCGGGGDPHAGHDHGPGEGHDHGPEGHGEHDHSGHAPHGPNGGELLEVGEHVAHLEVLHDTAKKTMTIHVLGSDIKSPVELASPPKLNLKVNGEPLQVDMTGSGSTFTVTHDAFAGEPEGRIVLDLNGKNWQVPIAHAHHGDDDHGHGHKDGDGHDKDAHDHEHKDGDGHDKDAHGHEHKDGDKDHKHE